MTTTSCSFFAASQALLYVSDNGRKQKVAFLDSLDQLSPLISRGKKTVHGAKGYAHPAGKILSDGDSVLIFTVAQPT